VVIPREPSVATLIEYTHRLTSGLVLLLSVALCVWALRAHAKGHPVRRAASMQLFFMLTEAAIGAGLVLFQYVAHNQSIGRAFWMAAHLINTFLLIGAQTLTVWFASGRSRLALRGQGLAGALVGAGLVALMLLGVTGAIAALGDTLFPASSLAEGLRQDVSETAHVLLRLRVLHPLLAVGTGALVVVIASFIARLRPSAEVKRGAMLLGILYAVQLAVGVINLVLLAPVWMQLIHLLLADLVWISLVRLAAAGLAVDAPRAELRPSPASTASASGSRVG
jgi:cytochrome c oxidase assembly protein subunit 15